MIRRYESTCVGEESNLRFQKKIEKKRAQLEIRIHLGDAFKEKDVKSYRILRDNLSSPLKREKTIFKKEL